MWLTSIHINKYKSTKSFIEMNRRLSVDKLELKIEKAELLSSTPGSSCETATFEKKNDPYFVGLKKLLFFQNVSVNEIYGMQMLLFVNVIL